MRLNEVMETDVIKISPTETVERARALMDIHHIRHLVVYDDGEIHGVITDRDVGATQLPETPIEDAMSGPVITLPPTETVKKAANVMRGRKVGCVLVVDDAGKLKGIVSEVDLLEVLSNTGTSSKQRVSVRARGNKRRR